MGKEEIKRAGAAKDTAARAGLPPVDEQELTDSGVSGARLPAQERPEDEPRRLPGNIRRQRR